MKLRFLFVALATITITPLLFQNCGEFASTQSNVIEDSTNPGYFIDHEKAHPDPVEVDVVKTGDLFVPTVLIDPEDLEKYYPEKFHEREGQFLTSSSQFQNSGVIYPYLEPWDRGIVPLEFSSSFTDAEIQNFYAACSEISQHANVSCVPRGGRPVFIKVVKGAPGECWSYFGSVVARLNPGRGQELSLDGSDWCMSKFVIQHELLHALGMMHEQAHPLRDSYIDVFEDNIDPNSRSQYAKANIDAIRRNGTFFTNTFDFDSMMLYHSWSHNVDGRYTMLRKTPDAQGSREIRLSYELSDGDIETLRATYGPNATHALATVPFSNGFIQTITVSDLNEILNNTSTFQQAIQGIASRRANTWPHSYLEIVYRSRHTGRELFRQRHGFNSTSNHWVSQAQKQARGQIVVSNVANVFSF